MDPQGYPHWTDEADSTVTVGQAAEAVNRHLGLGSWLGSALERRYTEVCRFVREKYLGRGVDLALVVRAAEGARLAIDAGEVSWLEDRIGKPTDGPGVLVSDAVVEGPDGSQLRNLFAIGLERVDQVEEEKVPDRPPEVPEVDVDPPKPRAPKVRDPDQELRDWYEDLEDETRQQVDEVVRKGIQDLPVESPSEVLVEGVRLGVWRQIQRHGLPNGDGGGGEGVEERKRRAEEQIRVMQEAGGGT